MGVSLSSRPEPFQGAPLEQLAEYLLHQILCRPVIQGADPADKSVEPGPECLVDHSCGRVGHLFGPFEETGVYLTTRFFNGEPVKKRHRISYPQDGLATQARPGLESSGLNPRGSG